MNVNWTQMNSCEDWCTDTPNSMRREQQYTPHYALIWVEKQKKKKKSEGQWFSLARKEDRHSISAKK